MHVALVTLSVILLFSGILDKNNPIDYQVLSTVITSELAIDEAYDQKLYETVVLLKKCNRTIEFPLGDDWTDQGIINDLGSFYNMRKVYELLKSDPAWFQLIKAYNERTATPKTWKEFAIPGRNTVLIKQPFSKKMSKKDQGWEFFYRKFPDTNGFFEAARPVIQGNKALIYVASMHAGLDGVGKFYFLEKQGDWKILADIEIWVA